MSSLFAIPRENVLNKICLNQEVDKIPLNNKFVVQIRCSVSSYNA